MSASRAIKLISILLIGLLIFGGIKALGLYNRAFSPSVILQNSKDYHVYIPTGATYDSVHTILEEAKVLKSIKSFDWTANRKNYHNHVKPGRYLLKHRMSNNELVNMLRSGKQDFVQLTFNNIRTIEELARTISEQLELDTSSLMTGFTDSANWVKYKKNKYTIPCMFIPNTYQMYWNTSKDVFLDRMHKEYLDFWSKSRLKKAKKLKMTPEEVITMASIVNLETRKNDEKKTVAGVYVNRMRIGMRLQADPTIIFAHNNFDMRRVLNKHRNINSPYNTYRYAGLPPGPICLPDISSIDAVLDYEKHNYIYFCAKPDFSGYHSFARTLTQHNKNARAYQRELNKRRIYK